MEVKPAVLFPDKPLPAMVGGKAAVLGRLQSAFAVPAFFVVSPHGFGSQGLLPQARQSISAALARLGKGPFAVRSSAIGEDGHQASFAGQLDSYLTVPAEAVADRVEAVWRSGASDHVGRYRDRLAPQIEGCGESPGAAPLDVAVVVQRMVAAEVAGVAFGLDPVSQDPDRMVISAVAGLADGLVSGRTNGDTYTLTRDGGPISVRLEGETPVLSEDRCRAVARLVAAIETHLGGPQDVEWAFAGETLFVLQARPVTGLADPASILVWDNANIVESYEGVTSPMTFSFARYVYTEVYQTFARLMGVSRRRIAGQRNAFSNLLGYLDGRVYYNLLNWYRVLALFPGFHLNRTFMEQMMGVGTPLPERMLPATGPRALGPWRKLVDAVRLVWIGLRLGLHGLAMPVLVRRFSRRLEAVLGRSEVPLPQMPLWRLARHYRALEARLLSRWDAPLINDFLCMIAFGLSRMLLTRWCGEGVGRMLHNDFMIGQGRIVSAEPARRIREMAEQARCDPAVVEMLLRADIGALDRDPALNTLFEDYLDRFGDRCTQELKLESLTLRDDSSSLLQAIGFMAQKPRSAVPSPSADPRARLSAAMGKRRFRLWLLRWLIRWAKARVRDRENLRYERTRVFGRVRRILRCMGDGLTDRGVLDKPRDIFYLTIEEVLGVVEGTVVTADLKGLVALRRRDARRNAEKAEMPGRIETRGAVVPALAGVPRGADAADPDAAGDGRRRGLGCCRGVVRGRVRVVRDPRREAVRSGEILAARHTDPGWIALFANAAGIVVERGSLLSHSAIVARELGIPAIVAVPGLTDWLGSGDEIEIDGATGVVTRLAVRPPTVAGQPQSES
jgi:phosphohistidine swiveling domain-containing protein